MKTNKEMQSPAGNIAAKGDTGGVGYEISCDISTFAENATVAMWEALFTCATGKLLTGHMRHWHKYQKDGVSVITTKEFVEIFEAIANVGNEKYIAAASETIEEINAGKQSWEGIEKLALGKSALYTVMAEEPVEVKLEGRDHANLVALLKKLDNLKNLHGC